VRLPASFRNLINLEEVRINMENDPVVKYWERRGVEIIVADDPEYLRPPNYKDDSFLTRWLKLDRY